MPKFTKRGWRQLSLPEMVQWLQGKEVVAGGQVPHQELPPADHYDCSSEESTVFSDGSAIVLFSGYDTGYSEYTPGGPMEPTIYVQG